MEYNDNVIIALSTKIKIFERGNDNEKRKDVRC